MILVDGFCRCDISVKGRGEVLGEADEGLDEEEYVGYEPDYRYISTSLQFEILG